MLDASYRTGRILQGEGYDFAFASLAEDDTALFAVHRQRRDS